MPEIDVVNCFGPCKTKNPHQTQHDLRPARMLFDRGAMTVCLTKIKHEKIPEDSYLETPMEFLLGQYTITLYQKTGHNQKETRSEPLGRATHRGLSLTHFMAPLCI